jgi:hypothetical protein
MAIKTYKTKGTAEILNKQNENTGSKNNIIKYTTNKGGTS